MFKGLTIFLLTGLFLTGTLADEQTWGYPDMEKEEEFPDWGGLCDKGKLQSPIALSRDTSIRGDFPHFDFDNYEEELKDAEIVNNGHTVKIHKFSNDHKVSKGCLEKDTYELVQMHFHWNSEHKIEGERYALELHLVHVNDDYGNFTEAVQHDDGVVVFAVLFHISHKDNDEIAKILEQIDEICESENVGVSRPLTHSFAVKDLMPDNPNDEYFNYEGSLTTPDCAENVEWIVYKDSLPITLEQVESFKRIEEKDGDKIDNNFRFIQKAHRRAVTWVRDEEDHHDDDDDDDDDDDKKDKDDKDDKKDDDDDDDNDDDDDKDNAAGPVVNKISASALTFISSLALLNGRQYF
ncbi:carbonic anhydrase 1-like [Condylostylus longicornis]|uniref:carbonic anhydrase 1-like n=1 Tax=Condylostylus longicornis TaxID=2530218 RepID=UPI00244E1FBF|nr:carbonic anhydrase 1-like [Condylostylus longicornis]